MRYGELPAFEERPHSPYFGTADATPLYVVLLDEYERWTGDTKLVKEREPEARAALNWIDEYADLMGNGYISYQRRNEETGLENQCWKDSWDSISYRDGRLPGFPRATCELQGYAYDAKLRGARLARSVWKDGALADRLEKGLPTSSAASTATSGSRTASISRLRSIPRETRSMRSRRTTATSCGAASSRRRRRRRSQAPDGAASLLRLGHSHDSPRVKALQPDWVPRRNGVAVRQLVRRVGIAEIRLQERSRADRGRNPRRC